MTQAESVGKAAASVDDQQLMRRVTLRLMPLVTLIYLIAIIDRSNVGFAKLQMVQDLHMSEAVYGLGASLFFIGYLVFEIPSTLAVHRFGARGWLARIMLTWGIVTILLAFAYSTTTFYVLHALLHLDDIVTGRLPPSHWAIDFPGVFLPAVLLVVLCLVITTRLLAATVTTWVPAAIVSV